MVQLGQDTGKRHSKNVLWIRPRAGQPRITFIILSNIFFSSNRDQHPDDTILACEEPWDERTGWVQTGMLWKQRKEWGQNLRARKTKTKMNKQTNQRIHRGWCGVLRTRRSWSGSTSTCLEETSSKTDFIFSRKWLQRSQQRELGGDRLGAVWSRLEPWRKIWCFTQKLP